jgi:hypothetical protein
MFLGLLAAAAIAGCGNSTTPTVDGGAKPDLATGGNTSPDLSTAATKTGCNGYIECLINCGADTTCSGMCDKNVTTKGMMLFQQAIGCGQSFCLAINDMGSGECVLNAAGNTLQNKDGTAANNGTPCGDCLNNSLAGLFGDTCMPATSPDCNPAQCKAQNDACTASTP